MPESLGCPPGFVLDHGEVCKQCNCGPLKLLDAELNDSFGVLKAMYIPHNKKGDKTISSCGNIHAENFMGQTKIYINAGKSPLTLPNGRRLPGATPQSFAKDYSFKDLGNEEAKASFSTPFVRSKKTIRALHKIALEAACWFRGAEYVLDQSFDPIREFVLMGRGVRDLVVGQA